MSAYKLTRTRKWIFGWPFLFDLFPYPEPFEEDVTDTDLLPPNPPKIPVTSSSPAVNVTTSFSTSSHSSSNSTTGSSGESSWSTLPILPPTYHSTLYFLWCYLSIHYFRFLLHFITPSFPDLSVITPGLCAHCFSLMLCRLWACQQCFCVLSLARGGTCLIRLRLNIGL